MYHAIMVPVDLEHIEKLGKSLNTAIDLARHYNATVHYVAVTPSAPTEAAHSREEFTQKLARFASEQGEQHGIQTSSKVIVAADPSVELDDKLLATYREIGADLIVMASHVPGVADKLHLMSSNAGYVARHADISVFVVR